MFKVNNKNTRNVSWAAGFFFKKKLKYNYKT